MTQEKLAEAIGMSTAYIGDMEARERFPSAETIDKIAKALHVSPSTLFSEQENPESLKSNFRQNYTKTLQEELSTRILKDINDVCSMI